MEQYKVGIAGVGRVASSFEDDPLRVKPATHAGAYALNPRTKIIAGACRSEEKAARFMEKWQAERVYYDFKGMLANEELDILSICLPPELHYEAVMSALNLNRGIKAIFCEKPLSENLQDAGRMVKECEEKRIKLIVNHNRRWEIPYELARDKVEDERLGNLLSITMNYHSGLFVMGTHIIDTARFIAGDIDFVVGYAEPVLEDAVGAHGSANWRRDDPSVSGLLHFVSGARGFLNGSARRSYLIVEFDLQFENGRILIGNNGRNFKTIEPRESKYYDGINELSSEVPSCYKLNSTFKSAVDEIVECLDENKESRSSGKEALKTLEVLVALSESSKNGNKKIEL